MAKIIVFAIIVFIVWNLAIGWSQAPEDPESK